MKMKIFTKNMFDIHFNPYEAYLGFLSYLGSGVQPPHFRIERILIWIINHHWHKTKRNSFWGIDFRYLPQFPCYQIKSLFRYQLDTVDLSMVKFYWRNMSLDSVISWQIEFCQFSHLKVTSQTPFVYEEAFCKGVH